MRRKNRKLKSMSPESKINEHGRRYRTYWHEGKERRKKRLPRKLKKIKKLKDKIEIDRFFENNEKQLRPIYGDDWISHIIYGG